MWVKIDDNLMEHPKMIAIGIQGRALWLAGLCYANQQMTDGFLPDFMIPTLAARAGVTDVESTLSCMTTVYLGQKSPVWYRADGGYRIHDYADFQPSAEDVRAIREKRARAGRLGGIRS